MEIEIIDQGLIREESENPKYKNSTQESLESTKLLKEISKKISEFDLDQGPIENLKSTEDLPGRSLALSQFDDKFLFQNALVLVDHGDYELAINLLDTILVEDEYHQEALKWKGYCLTQLGKIDKAIESYYKLAESEPSESHLFFLAEAFYSAGQNDLAKNYYLRSLACIDYESPHLFQIYKGLGNIATHQGDFDEAEEYYNKAFTLMPHSDDLFVNYGILEIQRENYDVGIERLQYAIGLNQNNDKAWVGLALIYHTRGDIELSWGNLLNALDINPKNTTAVKMAIDWGMQQLEYERAIGVLERYFSHDIPSVDWVFTYAGLIYHSGDWKESKKVLEYILKEKPDYKPAYELLKKIDHKINI